MHIFESIALLSLICNIKIYCQCYRRLHFKDVSKYKLLRRLESHE